MIEKFSSLHWSVGIVLFLIAKLAASCLGLVSQRDLCARHVSGLSSEIVPKRSAMCRVVGSAEFIDSRC
jgi:hypothetical protein